MQLKTYKAADLATALSRARAELGPQALVLATSEIPGRLGLTSVEITVGVDRPLPQPAVSELRQASHEVRRLREQVVDEPAEPRFERRPSKQGGRALSPALRGALDALIRSGLSTDLAERFARIAARHLDPPGGPLQLAEASASAIASLLSFSAVPPHSKLLFVVGPSGCGKTTTVAKLAARIRLGSGRPVTFAEADGDRVGSTEQARIFSQHIGARFRSVHCAADLRRAVRESTDEEVVLVDSAGIGSADRTRLDALVDLRESFPEAEVALLIPSGLHHEEAQRLIRRFEPLLPSCVGLTKVDDGVRTGELVTALAQRNLPLAFFTNGHRVPDDIVEASARGLTTMMLRNQQPKEDR